VFGADSEQGRATWRAGWQGWCRVASVVVVVAVGGRKSIGVGLLGVVAEPEVGGLCVGLGER